MLCLVEAASQTCCDVPHAQLIAACHSLTGHCCSCTPQLLGVGRWGRRARVMSSGHCRNQNKAASQSDPAVCACSQDQFMDET